MIDDIEPASEIFRRTLEDARRLSNRPSPDQRWFEDRSWWEHLLRSSKGGFWVAEEGSTLVGIACAIIRDGEWLLTHLYVVPDRQGHGSGLRHPVVPVDDGDRPEDPANPPGRAISNRFPIVASRVEQRAAGGHEQLRFNQQWPRRREIAPKHRLALGGQSWKDKLCYLRAIPAPG